MNPIFLTITSINLYVIIYTNKLTDILISKLYFNTISVFSSVLLVAYLYVTYCIGIKVNQIAYDHGHDSPYIKQCKRIHNMHHHVHDCPYIKLSKHIHTMHLLFGHSVLLIKNTYFPLKLLNLLYAIKV